MKRRTFHAILTLFVALLGSAALLAAPAVHAQTKPEAAAPAAAGPKAVLREPVYDGGVVPKGEKVVHDFEIRNEGTQVLTITDVQPACGCTVAEFDKTIAPGKSGKVHAVVDTTTFDGPIAKAVTVLTDDPAAPRLQLTIKADVKPFVFVRPGYARFIQPQLSDPGTVQEILFSSSFDKLQVLGIDSPYPHLKVEHRPATAEERIEDGTGNQEILTLTFDYSKAPVGPIAEYVVVKTNHPKQPEVKIPISGFVRPMVVVTPTEANFGEIKTGGSEPVSATMIVKNYAAEDFAVTGAESTVPGVDVEVEPTEDGRQYNVRVTLDPDMPKGAFAGVIRLRTDNPRKPTIEIPLKGTAT